LKNLEPAPAHVALDGVLSIRSIDVVRGRLLDALAEHQAVQVDCTMAESVDLSLIQLLVAARLSARQAGKQLTLAAPAGAVLRAALVQGGFLPGEGTDQSGADAFWSGAL
jgi:anti-anti-sigma regulatory factor